MSGMTILISPLNWGFGHAGRMIPLARELQRRGNEVVFGADARLLPLIESELPGIKLIEIPGLHIRYSRILPQYLCIFLQLPLLIFSAVREHYLLKRLAREIRPSVIVSDNRFGFWHSEIFSVYVTHQLRIPFPRLMRFMEPPGAWIHRRIINRFDLCLVPDYPGRVNLSGRLSHDLKLPDNVHYMGPLSRFRAAAAAQLLAEVGVTPAMDSQSGFIVTPTSESPAEFRVAATPDNISTPGHPYCSLILSGPEPQRSLLLEKVTGELRGVKLYVLSATPVHDAGSRYPGITFIIKPDTGTMRDLVSRSTIVIARAGYTSVMELVSLGKGAVLVPTPGQTEQEYLGEYLDGHHGFITLKQGDTGRLGRLVEEWIGNDALPAVNINRVEISAVPQLSDSSPLFAEAINLMLEKKKK